MEIEPISPDRFRDLYETPDGYIVKMQNSQPTIIGRWDDGLFRHLTEDEERTLATSDMAVDMYNQRKRKAKLHELILSSTEPFDFRNRLVFRIDDNSLIYVCPDGDWICVGLCLPNDELGELKSSVVKQLAKSGIQYIYQYRWLPEPDPEIIPYRTVEGQTYYLITAPVQLKDLIVYKRNTAYIAVGQLHNGKVRPLTERPPAFILYENDSSKRDAINQVIPRARTSNQPQLQLSWILNSIVYYFREIDDMKFLTRHRNGKMEFIGCLGCHFVLPATEDQTQIGASHGLLYVNDSMMREVFNQQLRK